MILRFVSDGRGKNGQANATPRERPAAGKRSKLSRTLWRNRATGSSCRRTTATSESCQEYEIWRDQLSTCSVFVTITRRLRHAKIGPLSPLSAAIAIELQPGPAVCAVASGGERTIAAGVMSISNMPKVIPIAPRQRHFGNNTPQRRQSGTVVRADANHLQIVLICSEPDTPAVALTATHCFTYRVRKLAAGTQHSLGRK
jgi:hypothetical protein